MVGQLTFGAQPGSGTFSCEECGAKTSLLETDSLPICPVCGGSTYVRSTQLTSELTAAPVVESTDSSATIDETVESLTEMGAYLCYLGGTTPASWQLGDGSTRLGRNLTAEIRFDDSTVSRRHAIITKDETGYRILDDRSLNGVFVNRTRVTQHLLQHGDEIAIGRHRLLFVVKGLDII